MERGKILNQLRAMRQRTTENGCTEAEALAAGDMFGRLMDKYGFGQADLIIQEKDDIGIHSHKPDERLFPAVQYVAGSVGRFCDCKVWVRNKRSFEFFGHESDALVATYMMACFERALQSDWNAYVEDGGLVPTDPAKPNGRLRSAVRMKDFASFGIAMMCRLSTRVDAMKSERSARVDEDTQRTGNSLVVVKSKDVDRAYAQLGMKLSNRGGGRSRKLNGAAYAAGRSAGNRVQITAGVGQSRPAGHLTGR